jgi:hypothetical protein
VVVVPYELKLVMAPVLFEFHKGLKPVLVFEVLVLIPLKVILFPPPLNVVFGLH